MANRRPRPLLFLLLLPPRRRLLHLPPPLVQRNLPRRRHRRSVRLRRLRLVLLLLLLPRPRPCLLPLLHPHLRPPLSPRKTPRRSACVSAGKHCGVSVRSLSARNASRKSAGNALKSNVGLLKQPLLLLPAPLLRQQRLLRRRHLPPAATIRLDLAEPLPLRRPQCRLQRPRLAAPTPSSVRTRTPMALRPSLPQLRPLRLRQKFLRRRRRLLRRLLPNHPDSLLLLCLLLRHRRVRITRHRRMTRVGTRSRRRRATTTARTRSSRTATNARISLRRCSAVSSRPRLHLRFARSLLLLHRSQTPPLPRLSLLPRLRLQMPRLLRLHLQRRPLRLPQLPPWHRRRRRLRLRLLHRLLLPVPRPRASVRCSATFEVAPACARQ